MKAIELLNISKNYDLIKAVRNVSLDINDGELFGLLGVNGAGKTTIIKILSCLINPTSGDAKIYGKSILNDKEYVKEIINVSPQETAIAPKLTVYENLEFIARIYGFSKEKAKNRIIEITDELSLEEVINQKAGTLSGGWQRRLSIAMGLITNPRILFLDEPTLGLDVIARRELWTIIKKLKGKITIILTTHYLEEAEAICDRVAIMVKGDLKAIGTVEELKTIGKSESFEEAFVNIATGEEV